jgi:hypothetical protein
MSGRGPPSARRLRSMADLFGPEGDETSRLGPNKWLFSPEGDDPSPLRPNKRTRQRQLPIGGGVHFHRFGRRQVAGERLHTWALRGACPRISPRACSSAGRAPDWQSGGRRFDPVQVHYPSHRDGGFFRLCAATPHRSAVRWAPPARAAHASDGEPGPSPRAARTSATLPASSSRPRACH